jgi:membrane-bound acyltransferase YfiQ involved in biofilm formation
VIKQEPKIDIKDIIAAFCIYIGLLMFITVLHLLAINSTGNTAEVMNSTFSVCLNVYITLVIFGSAFFIIHLLKWLVWNVTTPNWLKKQARGR